MGTLAQRIVDVGGERPAGPQAQLLEQLVAVYAREGVMSGDPLPSLCGACRDAAQCWKVRAQYVPQGASGADPHSMNGCMFVPWVGPAYRPGGVCIVGLNLRYEGNSSRGRAVGSEFRIAAEQLDALHQGKRAHGSRWADATMRGAFAVHRSASGVDTGDPRGQDLAVHLLSTARLQAVKCSPTNHRSSPSVAMQRNCPSRFLAAELAVLRPAVLLVYGRAAGSALKQLAPFDWVDQRFRGFERLTMETPGGHGCEAFLLTHPAHGGWHRAQADLVESLRRRAPRLAA